MAERCSPPRGPALPGIVAVDAAEWVNKHATIRYLRRRGPRSLPPDAEPVGYDAFLATRSHWEQLRSTAVTAGSDADGADGPMRLADGVPRSARARAAAWPH